jgi:hypothetical protein
MADTGLVQDEHSDPQLAGVVPEKVGDGSRRLALALQGGHLNGDGPAQLGDAGDPGLKLVMLKDPEEASTGQ